MKIYKIFNWSIFLGILLHLSLSLYTRDMKIIAHKKSATPVKEVKKIELPPFDKEHIHITLTCQSGLESLVRRESERLGLSQTSGQDRLVFGEGNLETLYKLLIGSRFSNRVYIEIAKEKITDFDTLHDVLASITWGDYLSGKEVIVIEASSTRSTLTSIPTIQSVGQKAIYSTLHTPDNAHAVEVHILILLIDDVAHILLDITGDPLHKRGYRAESGEAPIKESLAAALIAFSGWRFREPMLDPFCGSGTIAIEAAMMARNIAPGLMRHFRIESLPIHNRTLFLEAKENLKSKIYPSGSYTISASDLDKNMIDIAKRNAERAGVAGDINFSCTEYLTTNNNHTIVTNPPYGKRLESESLHEIYTKLIKEIREYGGGFITTFPVDIRHGLANKKLLNGSEECRFWYKKN
ncbi:MAG: class I SAM-dependent RNA methyltransferase [Candidatus Altimarinota bacterium]